ncbi:MAG TPA: GNAT family N-acetyltransferase [Pyrinomonadaceae bacterium]
MDMLVNLLKLPPLGAEVSAMEAAGVSVRRAEVFEMSLLREFVEKHFSRAWADEISAGYSNKPVSIYVAVREGVAIGFAAYECTRKGFFGPVGVVERERGRGVGRALLFACLWGLRELGYVYGIIGGVGPVEFYERAVGATVIPGSSPGIYRDMLRRQKD